MFGSSVAFLNTRPTLLQRRICVAVAPSRLRPTPRKLSRGVVVEDRSLRARRSGVTAAVAESTPSYDVENSAVDAIVKYLTSLGWDSAWIDGVTERIAKRQLTTTPETVKAVCEYLMGLGLKEGQLCNMVSLCSTILGYDVETHLKPVVDHLTAKGVTNIPKLLAMRPKLLDYTPTADGSLLEKGKLRAAIRVEKKGENAVVGVVTYREGAEFTSAPLTPYSP